MDRLKTALAGAMMAMAALAAAMPSAQAEPRHYKIGIIGAGKVGGALGTLWAKAGDEVMFSSRHPEDLKALAGTAGPNAKVGTVAEAAAFGDVVLIAVPYKVFPEVAKAADPALQGKVVFDASNAIAARDGTITAEVEKVGIGDYSKALLPGVHLVRGFNAIHYTNMASDSNRAGSPVAIPLASDDATAIAAGEDLVRQAGFVPVVVPLKQAGEFGPGRPLGVGVFTEAEWKQKLGLAK